MVGRQTTSVMVAQDTRNKTQGLDRFGPLGGGNTLRPVCGCISLMLGLYMCYRHILTRPGGGSQLRWASEDNYNVFINQPCAGVLGQVVRVSLMVVLIQFRFNKIESN